MKDIAKQIIGVVDSIRGDQAAVWCERHNSFQNMSTKYFERVP
jgi:hypothetical protein